MPPARKMLKRRHDEIGLGAKGGFERSGREGTPGFKRALQVTLPANFDLEGFARAKEQARAGRARGRNTASGSRDRAVEGECPHVETSPGVPKRNKLP